MMEAKRHVTWFTKTIIRRPQHQKRAFIPSDYCKQESKRTDIMSHTTSSVYILKDMEEK